MSDPGRHPGGVNAVTIAGSVHWITDAIDLAVWRAYSTRSDGDATPTVF